MVKVVNPNYPEDNFYNCETLEEAKMYVELLAKFGIKLEIIPTQS